jgi:hypothetical protein
MIGAVLLAAAAHVHWQSPPLLSAASVPVGQSRIAAAYGRLPLSFEANHGQTDAQVKFLSHGNGYSLFLTPTESVLSLQKPSSQGRDGRRTEQAAVPGNSGAVLRMHLVSGNSAAEVEGLEELPAKSNYFIGNDPSRWRTGVPNYSKVRYQNVYSGIDLVYYGNQRQLEYDFVVSPGADPRTIRLAFQGNEKMRINGHGDLVLETAGSELRMHRPVVYQEVHGTRQSVRGDFVIYGEPGQAQGGGQVGFAVARYDANKPLIIDPSLSYSTYLGGSSADEGYGIAVDSSGNAYVTGWTASTNFPVSASPYHATNAGPPTSFDVFVTKLNPAASGAASLLYSTYLGGSTSYVSGCGGGAGNDVANGIAVDSSGNAYVVGSTLSVDFPTMNAYQPAHATDCVVYDAFMTKLNATGSALLYSTYLGGSDYDWGNAIAVDTSGNAYVTGATISPGTGTTPQNFPTTTGAFQTTHASDGYLRDAFVTKINTTLSGSASLIYSTYLGGTGIDGGTGIAIDSSGNIYVTGYTSSTNFPVSSSAYQATYGGGAYDAFVTRLMATNPPAFQTKHPYTLNDTVLDPASHVQKVTTAGTSAANQPKWNDTGGTTTSGSVVFTDQGSATYATYLGGTGSDGGAGIAVDSSGKVYVAGYTSSTNFPMLNAFQTSNGGSQDAFVAKLNLAASGATALVYSTYLGGSGSDQANGIAVDSSGNAYITGYTFSTNFPRLSAFQASNGGNADAFVAKLNPASSGSASLLYCSYLGGNGNDYGYGIAVDSSGNAYVTGATISTNFPTPNAFQAASGGNYDVFMTKISP